MHWTIILLFIVVGFALIAIVLGLGRAMYIPPYVPTTDDGRESLAQELRGVLRARGLWAPENPTDLITAFAQSIDNLRAEGMCDACAGEGPANCMCGGSGKAADAVIYLREKLFDIQRS